MQHNVENSIADSLAKAKACAKCLVIFIYIYICIYIYIYIYIYYILWPSNMACSKITPLSSTDTFAIDTSIYPHLVRDFPAMFDDTGGYICHLEDELGE